MRGTGAAIVFVAMLVCLPLVAVRDAAAREDRILLLPMEKSSQRSETLSKVTDEVSCLLYASAGQHLRVAVTAAGPGAIVLRIFAPNGALLYAGIAEDPSFDIDLTDSGDYRIWLGGTTMTSGPPGKFELTVAVTPIRNPENVHHLEEVGKGRYGGYALLINPRTGRAQPHTPYRLVAEPATLKAYGQTDPGGRLKPIYGWTDGKGRTKFVRTKRPERLQAIETVGGGGYGRNFGLFYEGTTIPVVGRHYRILIGEQPIVEGVSDVAGNTLYVTSYEPETLTVEVMDGVWDPRWYGDRVAVSPKRLCRAEAFFRRCFHVTSAGCEAGIRRATRDCRAEAKKDPHALQPELNDPNAEWPVGFARCVVVKYAKHANPLKFDGGRRVPLSSECADIDIPFESD